MANNIGTDLRALAGGLNQQRQQQTSNQFAQDQFQAQQQQLGIQNQRQEQAIAVEAENKQRQIWQSELTSVQKQTQNPQLAKTSPEYFRKLVDRGNMLTTKLYGEESVNLSADKIMANLDQYGSDLKTKEFYANEFGPNSPETKAYLNEVLPNYLDDPVRSAAIERQIGDIDEATKRAALGRLAQPTGGSAAAGALEAGATVGEVTGLAAAPVKQQAVIKIDSGDQTIIFDPNTNMQRVFKKGTDPNKAKATKAQTVNLATEKLDILGEPIKKTYLLVKDPTVKDGFRASPIPVGKAAPLIPGQEQAGPAVPGAQAPTAAPTAGAPTAPGAVATPAAPQVGIKPSTPAAARQAGINESFSIFRYTSVKPDGSKNKDGLKNFMKDAKALQAYKDDPRPMKEKDTELFGIWGRKFNEGKIPTSLRK